MGITPEQFRQMQQRVAETGRTARPVVEPTRPSEARRHALILGLDPSLRGTGYGVLRMAKPFPQTLVYGTISCPMGWGHSRCLMQIVQALREVLKRHQPTVCVVEGLFYAQNVQTA